MEPNDILPSPKVSESLDNQEFTNQSTEISSSKSIEQKVVSSKGSQTTSDTDNPVSNSLQSNNKTAVSSLGLTSTAATTQVDLPDKADDVDLIEKEWVAKAKDVVRSTLGDPYQQNDKLNMVKVGYIKKRFNKDINSKEE